MTTKEAIEVIYSKAPFTRKYGNDNSLFMSAEIVRMTDGSCDLRGILIYENVARARCLDKKTGVELCVDLYVEGHKRLDVMSLSSSRGDEMFDTDKASDVYTRYRYAEIMIKDMAELMLKEDRLDANKRSQVVVEAMKSVLKIIEERDTL